jgi:methylmalonic aciduria homocystinuria type C protein
MGVCLHPKYGGWFAMRGVFIIKNFLVYDLIPKEPIDVLNGNETNIYDLLNKFNFNWKDNTYRDVIKVEKKYSPKQLEYFLTDPSDRKRLILKWFEEENKN